jgi:hypothetical protein
LTLLNETLKMCQASMHAKQAVSSWDETKKLVSSKDESAFESLAICLTPPASTSTTVQGASTKGCCATCEHGPHAERARASSVHSLCSVLQKDEDSDFVALRSDQRGRAGTSKRSTRST